MRAGLRLLAACVLGVWLLAGCSINQALRDETYTVQRGDTLSGIAAQYNIDWRDLADWNRIPPPYRLEVGQRLYLKPFPPLDYAQFNQPGAQGEASQRRTAAPISPPNRDRRPPDQPTRTAQRMPDPGVSTYESRPSNPSNPSNPSSASMPTPAPADDQSFEPPTGSGGAGAVPEDAGSPPADTPTNRPAMSTPEPEPELEPPPEPTSPAEEAATPATDEADQIATASSASADAPPISAGGPSEDGWQWPASGKLLREYDADDQHRGIEIGGRIGAPIYAASSGTVAYNGTGLKGYGRLVIIKHDDQYLSAYGFVDRSLVSQGDTVTAGQHIADMGMGPGNEPMLHFEIRSNGDPVDPASLLPDY